MTAVQIIQTICPSLADSPSLSAYVQMARESLDSRFFGKMYEYAIAYKACHLFTLYTDTSTEGAIAGLGQVSGVTEGGLSIDFAVDKDATGNDELYLTKYGKMLKKLIVNGRRMDVNRRTGFICPPYTI